MIPRTVRANDKVEQDRGMISVERGPIVYCAEWPDNNFDIMHMLVSQKPKFTEQQKPLSDFLTAAQAKKLDMVTGQYVTTLSTSAQQLSFDANGSLVTKDEKLTLIPYYAWCHRGSGNMKVWLPQDLKATVPAPQPTLASRSKVEASTPTPALGSINDRLVPKDASDRSVPYYHWWPKNNSTEWITYTLPEASKVQSATVYWFSDQPWGGCTTPDSWNIQYLGNDNQWHKVTHADHYPTEAGVPCTVNFDPVTTTKVKLEVKLPEKLSSGLFEWSIQ